MKPRAFSSADIIERMFNRPLALSHEKARIALGVVGPRLDVGQLIVMGEGGGAIPIADLSAQAAAQAKAIATRPGDKGMVRRDWDTGRELDPYEIISSVAIIPIRGTLMAENGLNPASGATGYDGLSFKFRHALSNDQVRGILFDIDSPGGEITDLHELCDMIASSRSGKPMRAMVRGLCASAAYEAAAAVCGAGGDITISETGYAGSIGVITMHADFSKKLEQDGIAVTLIHEGANKADGSPFAPLPPEVEAEIRADIRKLYDMFVTRVARWRGLTKEAVRATNSKCFNAADAVSLGLVDKVMSWTASLDEFVAIVNGRQQPATPKRGRAGSRASTENDMPGEPESNTSALAGITAITIIGAASHAVAIQAALSAAGVDDITVSAIEPADASAAAPAASTTAASDERTRILALADLCPDTSMSASLRTAVESGASAGDFAIGLATEAKGRGASMDQLRAGAVQADQLPTGAAPGAKGSGQQPKGMARGAAIAARAAAMGMAGFAHLKKNG